MREENQDNAVRVNGLHKVYRMGEVDVPVLNGIDLDIVKGEITVILGASGSGKTTLMNMIGGIDRPTSGKILFDGRDIAGLNDTELTEYRRKNIGFVFQFYNLVPTLNARENVQVVTEISDNPLEPGNALELVGLAEWADHFPAQLSGGQQQRVSIARALAKQPAMMLCDEPTGALDAETGLKVLQILVDLNRKLSTTVVIITHASQIAELAHRVVRIKNGKAVSSERRRKIKNVGDISW